jgi:predicted Zn-dependent peptidase
MRLRTFTLLLLASTLAFAQASKAPPPAAPKPFKVPAKQTFTLPNGLIVTLVPYGQIPKVYLQASVRAGNLNEAADQVWLADLTGEMLREGTKNKTAEQVDSAFAGMGGSLSVFTGADQTSLSTDVLSEYAADAASLLAEVLTSPRLPESELARLKGDMDRRLAIAKTRPSQLANERFRKVMYGDHPYGRLFPTAEMIKSFTIADVQKFYGSNFGAQRTHIYVAGKFDPAAVRAALTKVLSGWPKGPEPLINIPKPQAAKRLEVIEKPNAVQSTLYIGLPVMDPSKPDYIPFQVMHTMLGGSFISRITQNIRENKGYTYSPNAQISTRYRDALWLEVADVTTAVTGASLKEIFGEIDGIRAQPPSADELQRIQRYMAGLFVLRNSSRVGLVNQLSFVDLHGLGDQYLPTYVQKVNAVTPQQVEQMAQKYIDPAKLTIVVVGDTTKINDQIAPYKPASTQ